MISIIICSKECFGTYVFFSLHPTYVFLCLSKLYAVQTLGSLGDDKRMGDNSFIYTFTISQVPELIHHWPQAPSAGIP